MRLSPPKKGTFLVAFFLGCISIANHYGGLRLPIVSDADYLILALSFLLLLFGAIFEAL
jgi:hypothetical protein